jgi:hypothetical protein
MNTVYATNSERNKVIYELWEKNLTIEKISSSTNIPRSTVGYYVRKFNRLSAKGKPVVFPGLSRDAGKQDSNTADSRAMSLFLQKIYDLVPQGDWEEIYYRVNSFKLLKELGFLTEIENRLKILFLLSQK